MAMGGGGGLENSRWRRGGGGGRGALGASSSEKFEMWTQKWLIDKDHLYHMYFLLFLSDVYLRPWTFVITFCTLACLSLAVILPKGEYGQRYIDKILKLTVRSRPSKL